jgi:D-alanine-D-alanine ligase
LEKSSVAIIYNEPVSPDGSYSEASRDILDQVDAVERSLARLGIPSIRIAFTQDLQSFLNAIEREHIQYAFNLCESVDENPRLVGLPAAVMDILGVSYTGSPALTLAITTDKLSTKRLLRACGIPTPKFETYYNTSFPKLKGLRFPLIVKPRFEDASIGIDQESIVIDEEGLRKILSELHDRFGPLILEEYISGREFNVSLFGYPSPRVMPIAEISFDEFPKELYPIVGYKAKWDRESLEYHHTPRVFPRDLPEVLERRICRIAMDCFHKFMLRDYGRVDFRVDHSCLPYVLEVNANPCISPDAGFPAALAQAGIGYNQFVRQLLQFVHKRKEERDSPTTKGTEGDWIPII